MKDKHQPPKEHCDHECVCAVLYMDKDDDKASPCFKVPECKHDTRSRPHPAPAPIGGTGCPYWNPERNLYPDDQGNHCMCKFSDIREAAARKAREDERIKTNMDLKILRQNIKKKEFKPYMNHDGKAVWYKDVEELIESLRSPKNSSEFEEDDAKQPSTSNIQEQGGQG